MQESWEYAVRTPAWSWVEGGRGLHGTSAGGATAVVLLKAHLDLPTLLRLLCLRPHSLLRPQRAGGHLQGPCKRSHDQAQQTRPPPDLHRDETPVKLLTPCRHGTGLHLAEAVAPAQRSPLQQRQPIAGGQREHHGGYWSDTGGGVCAEGDTWGDVCGAWWEGIQMGGDTAC